MSISRSIELIEKYLVEAGATQIAKSYEGDRPSGILFSIFFNEIPMTFQIPVKIENAYKILAKIKHPRTPSQINFVKEQAERTAWRCILDWVTSNLAMTQLEQADSLQMLFPYLYDGKANISYFDKLKSGGFLMLTDGN
jgi:hypothetical protein